MGSGKEPAGSSAAMTTGWFGGQLQRLLAVDNVVGPGLGNGEKERGKDRGGLGALGVMGALRVMGALGGLGTLGVMGS